MRRPALARDWGSGMGGNGNRGAKKGRSLLRPGIIRGTISMASPSPAFTAKLDAMSEEAKRPGGESGVGGHENDPLHGLTLEAILLTLVDQYGWDGLAERIPIRCFSSDPSIKSSLTFLRRTPWAPKREGRKTLSRQARSPKTGSLN